MWVGDGFFSLRFCVNFLAEKATQKGFGRDLQSGFRLFFLLSFVDVCLALLVFKRGVEEKNTLDLTKGRP